eukprot:g39.t1
MRSTLLLVVVATAAIFLAVPAEAGPLPLTLGVVKYCETIGKIWEGMSKYFLDEHEIELKVELYDDYDSMTLALLDGSKIDIAWNGPIAHVNAIQLAAQQGLGGVASLGMRDVDKDMTSVIIARKSWADDHGLAPTAPLRVESDGGTSRTDASVQAQGGMLSTAAGPGTAARAAVEAAARAGRLFSGTSDSPQGFLAPFYHLSHTLGLDVKRQDVKSLDVDLGKHGDTAVGEAKAIDELQAGRGDVALVSDIIFARLQAQLVEEGAHKPSAELEGGAHAPPSAGTSDDSSSTTTTSGGGGTDDDQKEELVVIEGNIFLDHCRFDVLEARVPKEVQNRFTAALLAMDMSNKKHSPTMLEEGIKKTWLPARLVRDSEMAAQMNLGGIKAPALPRDEL